MSRLKKMSGATRKEGEEKRRSTLVQSVTLSQKWKKRFSDTTGKRHGIGKHKYNTIIGILYHSKLCFFPQVLLIDIHRFVVFQYFTISILS